MATIHKPRKSCEDISIKNLNKLEQKEATETNIPLEDTFRPKMNLEKLDLPEENSSNSDSFLSIPQSTPRLTVVLEGLGKNDESFSKHSDACIHISLVDGRERQLSDHSPMLNDVESCPSPNQFLSVASPERVNLSRAGQNNNSSCSANSVSGGSICRICYDGKYHLRILFVYPV